MRASGHVSIPVRGASARGGSRTVLPTLEDARGKDDESDDKQPSPCLTIVSGGGLKEGDSRPSSSPWMLDPRSNRCFRCLAKGHHGSTCGNAILCWRCHAIGHRSFLCNGFPPKMSRSVTSAVVPTQVVNMMKGVSAPWPPYFNRNAQALSNSLVGIVQDDCLDKEAVTSAFRQLWPDLGSWRLSVLNDQQVVVFFSNNADRS